MAASVLLVTLLAAQFGIARAIGNRFLRAAEDRAAVADGGINAPTTQMLSRGVVHAFGPGLSNQNPVDDLDRSVLSTELAQTVAVFKLGDGAAGIQGRIAAGR